MEFASALCPVSVMASLPSGDPAKSVKDCDQVVVLARGNGGEESVASSDSAPARATQAPAIEAGSETDDEFGLDGGLLDDDTTASVTSSIYAAYAYERGRRYHVFGDGRYPIPNDDIEQSREDMKHAMLMMLTGNKPFLAPIGDHPQKILDIGTGTGRARHLFSLLLLPNQCLLTGCRAQESGP